MRRACGSTAAGSLWRVCLHECAHLAVARSFGACGFVRIRALRAQDGAVDFAGSFQMVGELGEREWRVVALAGTIAEWLDERPELDADAAVSRLRGASGALSRDDARLAAGWDASDVRECLERLRALWSELAREADEHATTSQ